MGLNCAAKQHTVKCKHLSALLLEGEENLCAFVLTAKMSAIGVVIAKNTVSDSALQENIKGM